MRAEPGNSRAPGGLFRPLAPIAAIGASIALHAAAVLVAGSVVAWRGWAHPPRLDLQLAAVQVRVLEELPLGPPPEREPEPASPDGATATAAAGPDQEASREAKSAPAESPAPDAERTAAATAGPIPEAGANEPGQPSSGLSIQGPGGSRLTATLRIDRLRAGADADATIAAVDALLARLPDRHRLLDGTGLDLYRDFDSLLVATPDPSDDAVTFLAARHHLPEPALQAALDRAAEAQGRPLRWQPDAERPVAVRPPPTGATTEGDERLFALPAPGLVVTAPSAYAGLLLPAGPELVARIDAENGGMPEDAVLRITAAHLLRASGSGPEGLPAPESVTVLSGLNLAPYLEVTAEFATVEEAEAAAGRWPALKQQALANPLVLFAGFAPLVSGAELRREGRRVILRAAPTPDETRRILVILAGLSFGGPGAPGQETAPP